MVADDNTQTQKSILVFFIVLFAFFVQCQKHPSAPTSPGDEQPHHIDMDWITVIGGAFDMGDNWGLGEADELPVHQVILSSFQIGKYEVTNAQFAQFLNEFGTDSLYSFPMELIDGKTVEKIDGNWQAVLGYENFPIDHVLWHWADQFCRFYNLRLLTEAEWEYAARGGNMSHGYQFSGSNIADEVAWYSQNSDGERKQVGLKTPNELGIYDMSGNVWEWCWDWFDGQYYTNSPLVNPQRGQNNDGRVLRGGHIGSSVNELRVSNRLDAYYSPIIGFGFRCARAVDPSSAELLPSAYFSVKPVNGTTETVFSFDASLSSISGDTIKEMQVRWDWQNDGLWDTDYIANKQITCRYRNSGEKTIRLEVKDSNGHVDDYIKTISVVESGSDDVLELEWIHVEGGTYDMSHFWNTTTHKVTLTSFEISKHEVTNAQFSKFMDEYGSDVIKFGAQAGNNIIVPHAWGLQRTTRGWRPTAGYENYPVVNISWYGALEFCRFYGYRLPTEAQWEYAAKGGDKSHGYTYSGSNNADDVAWYAETSNQKTHRVGQKQPNELGIYDMSGNAWEWCWDNFNPDYYLGIGPQENPEGPVTSMFPYFKVIRGGSWKSEERQIHVDQSKGMNYEVFGNDTVGFRCVR
jgi:formylglycine-generating enzyme required for sulfatase activity